MFEKCQTLVAIPLSLSWLLLKVPLFLSLILLCRLYFDNSTTQGTTGEGGTPGLNGIQGHEVGILIYLACMCSIHVDLEKCMP